MPHFQEIDAHTNRSECANSFLSDCQPFLRKNWQDVISGEQFIERRTTNFLGKNMKRPLIISIILVCTFLTTCSSAFALIRALHAVSMADFSKIPASYFTQYFLPIFLFLTLSATTFICMIKRMEIARWLGATYIFTITIRTAHLFFFDNSNKLNQSLLLKYDDPASGDIYEKAFALLIVLLLCSSIYSLIRSERVTKFLFKKLKNKSEAPRDQKLTRNPE